VDNLRAAGATVDPAGVESQPFFMPEGQLLSVNGQDVQAMNLAALPMLLLRLKPFQKMAAQSVRP
jgi:hypothetical protein